MMPARRSSLRMFSRNLTGRHWASAKASALSGPPPLAASVSRARMAYSTLADTCTHPSLPVPRSGVAVYEAPAAANSAVAPVEEGVDHHADDEDDDQQG